LSIWSKSVVESVIELSVGVLSIGVLAVGVSTIVVGVHAREDTSHFVVVGNSTQWVLAKTPSSHVSIIGVSGNSAPRELHSSIGRKDSVSGTSVVGDSIANKRELALVSELG